MNFRPIESRDLPGIIEVRASTRENHLSREALRQLGVTEESTVELLRTTHRGWLCEEEGRIVGFSIGDGKTGELWVIAVLPEFEGRGVGSRLLQSVEAWLWSLDWPELWLWTSPDRQKRAFMFYQKHGWLVSELKDGMLYMKKRRPNQPMTTTPQPKTVRKSLSLILAGIGAVMMIGDITLGAARATDSFYVPAGLPLVAMGAALYYLRRKEERALAIPLASEERAGPVARANVGPISDVRPKRKTGG